MKHIYRIFTEQMAATNYFQLIISVQFYLLFKQQSNLKSLYIQLRLSQGLAITEIFIFKNSNFPLPSKFS